VFELFDRPKSRLYCTVLSSLLFSLSNSELKISDRLSCLQTSCLLQ